MAMPSRNYTAGTGYRYGFNGKEKDKETTETTTYDYGFRIYSPALGRFLSVDPLTKTYPWYTPYQFAGNKPIWAIDVDGLEENTTSTYVYKNPPISIKPTFKGVINITDATTQTIHKTFSGNYAQLKKSDATGLGPAIVNQLLGSETGNSSSDLSITMTGSRSQVFKSWKGTDIKYFTQYSYSFTNNNITEIGTFEMQTGQIQAGARAWDPLVFLLVNRLVNSIVQSSIVTSFGKAVQSMTAEALEASKKVFNGTKLYRLGTMGKSVTGTEAQFWSLENPLTMSAEEYAKKYGVPLENVKKADFVETAILKDGAKYITREAPIAPGAPAGSGGGIEAVVEKGGTSANVITPIKR